METHLLALVRTHLNSGQFLYSYGFDVTRRLQAQYVAREKDEGKPMWEIVGVAFSKDTTSVSSSALRQMTGFSGISEARFPESACRAHRCSLQVSTVKIYGYIHLGPQQRCESWMGINTVVLIPYIDECIYPSRDKRKCVLHPHVEHVVKCHANMPF